MDTPRRWIFILATLGVAAGVMAWAQDSKPRTIMGSSVFDWTQIVAKKSAKGESRQFFQAPTATLDELEVT